MSLFPSFDEVTLDDLRAAGGLKWSRHPEAVGAFIAEMDFGTAPPILHALHEAVDEGLFGYLPESLVIQMAQAWCGLGREPLRLAGLRRASPTLGRRTGRAPGRDRVLLPTGHAAHSADAGVHAVPHYTARARPIGDPSADGDGG